MLCLDLTRHTSSFGNVVSWGNLKKKPEIRGDKERETLWVLLAVMGVAGQLTPRGGHGGNNREEGLIVELAFSFVNHFGAGSAIPIML
jgi:hypothetical protein